MFEQRNDEAASLLLNAQRGIDLHLRQIFDPDVRARLQQAQVHIHEALLLLQTDPDGEAVDEPGPPIDREPHRRCEREPRLRLVSPRHGRARRPPIE